MSKTNDYVLNLDKNYGIYQISTTIMYFRGADSRLSFNQFSLYTLPCLTAGGGTIFSKIDSFDFESLQPVHSSKIAQV